MTVKEAQLVTVRQFCERFAYPSQSALRAIILDAATNGFDKAIFRVGRRVLVNVPVFFQIIEEKNAKDMSKNIIIKKTANCECKKTSSPLHIETRYE